MELPVHMELQIFHLHMYLVAAFLVSWVQNSYLFSIANKIPWQQRADTNKKEYKVDETEPTV